MVVAGLESAVTTAATEAAGATCIVDLAKEKYGTHNYMSTIHCCEAKSAIAFETTTIII